MAVVCNMGYRKYSYQQWCINSLYDKVMSGDLNTMPSYQREIVWTDAQQEALITTICNGMPIPSISIVEEDISVSDWIEECLDGKNRINSIIRFMNDEIQIGTKTYTELSDRERRWFGTIQIQVCLFTYMDVEERRKHFRAIQAGVPLKKTEITWSHDECTLLVKVKELRYNYQEQIANLWSTKNRSDIQLLFTIINFIEYASSNKNVMYAKLINGGNTERWLLGHSNNLDYSSVIYITEIVLNKLTNIISTVEPVKKIKQPIIYDLTRVLAYNKFNINTVSSDKCAEFINMANMVYENPNSTVNPLCAQYISIIMQNTGGAQTSVKTCVKRTNLLLNFLG